MQKWKINIYSLFNKNVMLIMFNKNVMLIILQRATVAISSWTRLNLYFVLFCAIYPTSTLCSLRQRIYYFYNECQILEAVRGSVFSEWNGRQCPQMLIPLKMCGRTWRWNSKESQCTRWSSCHFKLRRYGDLCQRNMQITSSKVWKKGVMQ